jgi:hypothetical protein
LNSAPPVRAISSDRGSRNATSLIWLPAIDATMASSSFVGVEKARL